MNILPIKKIETDLSTWHPFEEMSNIHERINQLFNRLSGDEMSLTQQAWNPLMDVVEKDNEYYWKWMCLVWKRRT